MLCAGVYDVCRQMPVNDLLAFAADSSGRAGARIAYQHVFNSSSLHCEHGHSCLNPSQHTGLLSERASQTNDVIMLLWPLLACKPAVNSVLSCSAADPCRPVSSQLSPQLSV